jgi:phosphohistidine swiveling domain-containing protein
MSEIRLVDLRAHRTPPSVGGKAANLRRLIERGFRVPVSHVIPWEAYDRYLAGDPALIDSLQVELDRITDPHRAYAVRSSASVEDSLVRSFAGQFKTCLDVTGIPEILEAVRQVWDSAAAPSVRQYLERMPTEQAFVKMAVIVQEMVTPIVSGVAFSHNPMTGAAETVVEAVEGSGLQLVQEGVTPHRWIHKWGRWIAQPEETPIQLSLIQQVVDGVGAVARALKNPVDLEWVYDGSLLYWVQVREITTLKDLHIYSNRISREVLPGQIKPLVWSVNIPLVISQWIRLLTEMIGKNDLAPYDLAKQFHYYAYFNMGALGRVFNLAGFPSEGLEMMMGIVPKEAGRPAFRFNPASLRLVPRMLWFMVKKWTLEKVYQRDFPLLERSVETFQPDRLSALTENELLAEISRLFEFVQRIAWYNINVPILMNMYNALLNRQLHRHGVQPESFDLMEDMPDAGAYDPNRLLKALNRQYKDLPAHHQQRIVESSYAEFLSLPGIEPFQAAIAQFLRGFGHYSNSGNDFSAVPWREQPELILRMVCDFEPPHTPADGRMRLDDIRRPGTLLRLFHGRTRRFRLYRDHISHHYTYSYGLFRDYFRELSQRLVDRGLLEAWQDILYLTWEEIQELVHRGDNQACPARQRVEDRKADMESSRTTDLPLVIYGDEAPPVVHSNGERITGTPTSPGYYSGRVCIVGGIQDFDKLQQGDILVIPYSDVGWAPLFARAGAVIAESGGILSHSAIVAREYRIPAVLSVDSAMQRLEDGQMVTVDGYKGEIIPHAV